MAPVGATSSLGRAGVGRLPRTSLGGVCGLATGDVYERTGRRPGQGDEPYNLPRLNQQET